MYFIGYICTLSLCVNICLKCINNKMFKKGKICNFNLLMKTKNKILFLALYKRINLRVIISFIIK